jgi:hypothetical protein
MVKLRSVITAAVVGALVLVARSMSRKKEEVAAEAWTPAKPPSALLSREADS